MRATYLLPLTPLLMVAACGGPETNLANDAQANVSKEAAQGPTAQGAAAQPLGAPVSGSEAKRIMDERHEGMEEIGDTMKAVGAALKADDPDFEKIRKEAGTMARLSQEADGWYPPGTGPETGKTHAKAEIWQKPEDFAAKMRTFQQAAQAFNAAAQGNDINAIRAAAGNLGKSCKACHDPYRRPKKAS